MKVLFEGLFLAVVLLLELVGMVVLGRSAVTTETYPLASLSATPTVYIVTSQDEDGGAYWVEWEDPSCGMLGVPAEGVRENFSVRRSGNEVVGIGEAAGCRGLLRPQTITSRQPGIGPPGGGH